MQDNSLTPCAHIAGSGLVTCRRSTKCAQTLNMGKEPSGARLMKARPAEEEKGPRTVYYMEEQVTPRAPACDSAMPNRMDRTGGGTERPENVL